MEAIIDNQRLITEPVEPPWEYFLREPAKKSTETAGAPLASSTPQRVESGLRLGDMVEKGLKMIGVTAKPSCGCAKRKKFLNDLI